MKSKLIGIITINLISFTFVGGCAMTRTQEIMKLFFKDLPVLVTGGAGFIGSHIVEKLVELGARVTVLDNLSTGSLDNLSAVLPHITFIKGSITDKTVCLEATRGISTVFHLAAFISVPDSLEHPLECYTVNVEGTLNLLEACRCNSVERFIFSSSAAVYGSRACVCSEETPPHPESPYGTSKLIGEFLCQQYARNYGLQTVCLRYFNVFGERQNPHGAYAAVVAKFKYQMQHNLPITIFGDGQQTRDFIPVGQVAQANLILAMLEQDYMKGDVFNIGTGKSITLLELIDLLKTDFPSYNQSIHFEPERQGDIKYSQADCQKYLSILHQ
jgi:UDP-glucose 4-epimerase